MKAEAQATDTDEFEWILRFKHNHAYEVRNGWKMWESSGSQRVSDSNEGTTFQLMLECLDCDEPVYECIDCEQPSMRDILDAPSDSSANMLFLCQALAAISLLVF